jgi:hypothetical protein
MAHRAPVLVGLLLVGLLSACAGQQAGGPGEGRQQGGDQQGGGAGAPGPVSGEWQTDGCGTPRSPVIVATAGATFPVVDDQIQELVKRITPAGQGRFAAVYAGLELSPDQVRLIVHRRPSAEFDGYLRAEAGDQCLIVRDAVHSLAELQALADRITGDMKYWRDHGIAINTVGCPQDGSAVEVGTEDVAAAQVELPKRYGTAIPIKVVEQGPIQPLTGVPPVR